MFRVFQEGFYLLKPTLVIERNRGYEKARMGIHRVSSFQGGLAGKLGQLWIRLPKSCIVVKLHNEIVGLVDAPIKRKRIEPKPFEGGANGWREVDAP